LAQQRAALPDQTRLLVSSQPQFSRSGNTRRCESGWAVRYNYNIVGTYSTKEEAVNAAKNRARDEEPPQVVVQGEDGKWQDESAYGDDRYPPKG
jgi:hypothetical protein